MFVEKPAFCLWVVHIDTFYVTKISLAGENWKKKFYVKLKGKPCSKNRCGERLVFRRNRNEQREKVGG